MKLYIIRHGETAWNVEGRLQGQSDTELNENGVRLAKVTAEGLKNIPFDLGISSPLRRAKHTAELVLAGRNVPLTTDDRLMELSFGSWEGLGCRANNFEIPSEHFDDFYRDPFHFRPAGDGETIQEVCDRAEAFYHELTAKPELQDKTILIASHGCAVRALLQNLYKDPEHFWHGCVPPNCSINLVEVQDGKARFLEEDKVYA